jgi:hypothetical protein
MNLEPILNSVDGASGVALNLWGVGNPNGVVTAPFATKFDEYDENNNFVAQWTKKTNAGNNGWI